MAVPLLASLLVCCALMLFQASTAAKLAFLTPPRHHQTYSFPTTLHYHHPTTTNAARIYSLPRLQSNSQLTAVKKDSDDNNDDDSICEVYQQVKEEDSEWYSKISQMLGNDEMELLDTTFTTCGDDKVKPKSNGKFNQGITEEVSKQDTNNTGGDQSSKDNANHDDVVVSTNQAAISKESPQSIEAPTKNDSPVEATADEPPKKQDSAERAVAGSHSEGHYTQFLDDDENEEDVEVSVGDNRSMETKSKVESSEAATKEDVQPTQNQDDRVDSEQAPPPSIVRIYNEFTNKYENIAPLSALQKLGYNENELKLLRPQVLELIVDDRIPRPRRGIPKRWVKSAMNDDDQYDEEEERYDDDFGWQVQVVVVSRKEKEREIESAVSQTNEERVHMPKDDTDEAGDERMDNKIDDDVPEARYSSDSHEDEIDSRVEDDSSRANNGKTIDNDFNEGDNEVKQQPRPRQQKQPSIDYEQDYEQDFRRERGYRPPPQRRRQPPPPEIDDGYYNERSNSRRPRRERGSSSNRRQRTPKRQELLIDRDSYGDDPSGNKFWMGLPMFKDFLRKEAQFRLKILGPDWKESVMDESRWRYDLYKTWLQMIDEGVGENPLYTYSDQPRQRRRRSRSQQSDANYERERNARNAPRRQEVTRSQPDARQRRTVDDGDDDGVYDDYDYEEPSNKQKLDDVEEDQRRRTRQPEQRRTEQRPRRQARSSQTPRNERWTNFNDLEESLMKSKGEPRDSREVYPRRRPDSYDDEIPRRRRRTSDIYEEGEESDEEEAPRQRYSTDDFDSQDEDIRPRRRRRRE